MKKLKYFLRRIYRLSLPIEKQEALVWKDLKQFYTNLGCRFGVYEKEKCIEVVLEISEDQRASFFQAVQEYYLTSRVKVLEDFPVEQTSELFILATHFNNLLKRGSVLVNVNHGYVEYCFSRELLLPLLYSDEIEEQVKLHYTTSEDIHWAFQRLINEQEEPAIIIADLLKKKREEKESNQ
jgi:hypothetical protein